VQRDPTNAAAWFELGVKQQENEREAKAIQSLQRAVDLDPSHLPTWLALSVSYTNDNHRLGAYDAIREWVLRNPKYETVVSGTGLATGARGDFAGLIDVLIQMARSADQQQGGVDGDVQVALAVLLNTTEVRLFF
jgi:peroxin-5